MRQVSDKLIKILKTFEDMNDALVAIRFLKTGVTIYRSELNEVESQLNSIQERLEQALDKALEEEANADSN